jgi:hypothetical protein
MVCVHVELLLDGEHGAIFGIPALELEALVVILNHVLLDPLHLIGHLHVFACLEVPRKQEIADFMSVQGIVDIEDAV